MDFITLDFETYFDKDCNIKKLSTSQYVQHPDFHALTLAWKTPKMKECEVLVGREIDDFFDRLRPHADRVVLCGHHMHFDGYVASYHYGFVPARYVCTLAMAQPHHSEYRSTSLASLAEYYGFREGKIKDVLDQWKGLRWDDATPEQQEALCRYNKEDTALTEDLARKLLPMMPKGELDIIDMTVRMFADPLLEIDVDVAQSIIDDEMKAKDDSLRAVFGDEIPLEKLRTMVRSNPGFAELLTKLGVEPPMKISPTTGKWTYAFAKADLPFQALEHHDDERVRNLFKARVANKSSINLTRAQAMMDRSGSPVPLYLKYCSAHTFRFGGGDNFNPQNFPRDGRLRSCLKAPDGYKIVAADAAQIEARDTAVLSEQWDLVDEFARGIDVYSSFASEIYGFPVNKNDHPLERFIGKTCLGADTKVLTPRGWVPITEICLTDQVWDGVEWVNHQGVSYMGQKKTILLDGVELTPDHEILAGSLNEWVSAQTALENPAVFQSALSLATLPSLDTKNILQDKENIGAGDQFAAAIGVGLNTAMLQATSVLDGLQPATPAPKLKPEQSVGGSTKTLCLTTSIGRGYSTDCRQLSGDATLRVTPRINTMGIVVSKFIKRGLKTAQNFYGMFKRWMDGTTQSLIWTESTWTEITNRETYGSALDQITCQTSEKSKNLKPVYDLLNCGKRSRFTILSDSGPLIVHNCILGLGYQCGANKFFNMLQAGVMGPPVDIEFVEAEKIVQTYRKKYYCIKQTWHELQSMIPFMLDGSKPKEFRGQVFEPGGTILMPNGLRMHYPHLTYEVGDYGTAEFSYKPYDGKYRKLVHKKLYGGSLLENLVQSRCRTITTDHAVKLNKYYRVVLLVHDEIVMCVPENKAEDCLKDALEIMSEPPDWNAQIPLAAEGGIYDHYVK